MARSDYELSAEIFGVDEVHRLLDADLPDRCDTCTKESAATARHHLTMLGTWWMSELPQRSTGLRTRVTVYRRLDGMGNEAWFALQVPRWHKPIRVLLGTIQHSSGTSTRKKRPHYQMQVPCTKELKSDVNKSGYEVRVNSLAEQLRSRLADLQQEGNMSISLTDLNESDLGRVEKEVAVLVETLGRWEWGPM